MSDDLVKRARDQQTKWITPLLDQMADRIEELVAELEKQKAYKEDYKAAFNETITRVEALETENARLRDALERTEVIGVFDAPRSLDAIAAAKIARATLKGENQ